jgi:hypothetical protein
LVHVLLVRLEYHRGRNNLVHAERVELVSFKQA